MPYPSQITQELVLETACEMIEAEGVDGFSMHQLAKELGVKTPSLYRYFKNKTNLLRAVNEMTMRELIGAIAEQMEKTLSHSEQLLNIALTYRDYAHAYPRRYGLMYTNTIDALRPDDDEAEESMLPFQALMAEFSGEADSLPALRGIFALMHGFVILELAGQLRRGGDLDEAYRKSLTAYLAGWTR